MLIMFAYNSNSITTAQLANRRFITMTHYYLYIESGDILDNTSRFYYVGVGTTVQSQRDYNYLLNYAEKHGHFFALISRATDEFLAKVKNSLYPSSVNIQRISARDFVRHIKSDTRPALPGEQLANIHHLRMQMNLDYRISSRLAAG